MESLRAFIAIRLPPDIIELAGELQSRFKSAGLKLRWVRLHSLHLTLRFLGNIPEQAIADLKGAMQRASLGYGPLDLAAQGMGVFPGIKRPRVLWIGIGGELHKLSELVAGLGDELERIGFAKKKRAFRGHLTLARMKRPVDSRILLEAMQDFGRYNPRPFSARQMILYQSDLRPQGALYTARATVNLASRVDASS
jgi:2'-5' RNA ligase